MSDPRLHHAANWVSRFCVNGIAVSDFNDILGSSYLNLRVGIPRVEQATATQLRGLATSRAAQVRALAASRRATSATSDGSRNAPQMPSGLIRISAPLA